MDNREIIDGKVDWKGRPARKGVHGGFSSSLLILTLFGLDNFANAALTVTLVTYVNSIMHFDIASASTVLTNLLGTSYLAAVFISYLADTYVGRYKVVLVCGGIEFLGLALLTVQAHTPSLKPPACNPYDPTSICVKVEGGGYAFMYAALYLTAIGMAGVKAGVPSHGADQFDEKDPDEALSMSSFFNWFLLSVVVGAAFSVTLLVWIQQKAGWDWFFGVSTIGMGLGILVFVTGLPRYRIHVMTGISPITEIVQVFVAAIRNRNLNLPDNPSELYELPQDKESALDTEFTPHRDMFRFLDKAAIQTTTEENPNPWKLCRVTQVETAKMILGMVPIFASAIIMSTCLAQLQTFSIQQGITMDLRLTKSFNIPPASIILIPLGFLIIVVPVYDRLIVPALRKITGHATGITHFQRIGIGLVLSCISMSIAALVEVKRKNVAKQHGMLDAIPLLQPLPISTFWLSFQFFVFGIADMFTYVGLLEFFHSEAPKALKSVAVAFLWFALGLGYFVSTILVELVNSATKESTKSRGWLGGNNLNRNYLNYFYWLLAILSVLNLLNYLFWANRYKYKAHVMAVAAVTAVGS